MRRLIAGSTALALSALLPAPFTSAAPHQPTGPFAQFGNCPLSQKAITNCIYSLTPKGSVKIGRKMVPLKNPVTLQGGFLGEGQEVTFVGAENGETLSVTPQPVPGGLLGISAPAWWPESLQGWFNQEVEKGATAVTATLELAAPAGQIKLSTENLLNQEGTALGLPVKIKLDNPLLGSNCYIGSDSDPIEIDFTAGKSGPIEGSVGVVAFKARNRLITITGGRLASGTFAAPRASGCGGLFSYFIDPLVNSILGLPSKAGDSTAILEGELKSGAVSAVRNSE